MDRLRCDICTKVFDERKRIPKMLRCGHTLCSLCVPNIGTRCPTCRKKVPTTEDEIVTNFIILSLVKRDKRSLHQEKIKRYAKVIEKWLLNKNVNLKTDLEMVKEILSAEGCRLSNEDINELINEIRERNAGSDEVKEELKPNHLLLDNFGGAPEYFSHISNLLIDGKRVYACHRERKLMKYGQVVHKNCGVWLGDTVEKKDLLVINSLSEPQVEESAMLLTYSDLQQFIKANKFSIYLKFCEEANGHKNKGEKIIFFSPNESRFLPQLIQLCTGQKGPTYKGAKFSVVQKGWNYELTILNQRPDAAPTTAGVDRLANVGSRRNVDGSNLIDKIFFYIEMDEDGRLKVIYGDGISKNDAANSDIIFFSRCFFQFFWHECEGHILDSGIGIEL